MGRWCIDIRHYGDITKLHGGDLPFVDVIAGGSPCQDLSVAGKRAGMLNEANGDEETTRSGLFYDQIRINKEMREAYVQARDRGAGELVRPVRYSIWENVPGAFSSNGGKDFQAVLTEFIRIVEPEAPDVPLPEKGKWPTAGCLYDEMGRWSLAWRLHDLQFWGCPQRRKRLCVLVDFDGPTAPWILFDPEFRGEAEDTPPIETESDPGSESRSEVQPLGEGLRGHSEQSGAQGQGTAGAAESSTGGASYTLKIRGGIDVDSHGRKAGKGALVQTELSGTLGVSQDQTLIQPCLNSWDVQSKHVQPEDGVAEALYSGECRGGGGVMNITEDKTNALRAQMKHHEPIVYNGETVTCPTNKQQPQPGDPSHTLTADDRNYLVYENHSQDSRYKELGEVSETVSAKYGTGGNNQPLVLESNQNHATVTEDGICNTLPAAMGMGGGYVPMVTYGIDQQGGKGGANYAEDVCPAVLSDSHGTPHAVAYGISSFDSNAMKSPNPRSGIYEADTSRTLDLNGGSPACNQGGVMILNPSDSQGNQVADDDGVYPTLRGCGGAGYQQGYCLDKNSEPIPLEGNGQRESHRGDGYGKPGDPSFTLNSTEHHGVASNWDGSQVSPTLTSNNAGGNQRMPDKDNFNAVIQPPVECLQVGFYQATGDMAPSLLSRDYKDPPVVSKAVDVRNGCESEDTNGSLQSKASNNLNSNNVCRTGAVVRRLTPKECERLQGFPDDWTDLGEWTDSKGKKHKDADSPRYKALGNSIGLPFWQWLAERIAAQYDRPVTLGSLFDGISGFPVCFKLAGGVPVWSSEIEEFCVAVAKKHFGDDDTGEVGDFDEAIQRRHKT